MIPRTSKYSLLSVDDAVTTVLKEAKPLEEHEMGVFDVTNTACSPVLAQDVFANVSGACLHAHLVNRGDIPVYCENRIHYHRIARRWWMVTLWCAQTALAK